MNLRERICLLVSQTLNSFVFDGDPDESLSARRYREGKPETIDRFFGKDHCKAVWQRQQERINKRGKTLNS